MNFNFTPYVRYASKNTYFISGKYVVAMDCRLLYILSGNGIFESEGEFYSLSPGTLIYYPYGVPYKISSDEGMMFYTINFDFNFQFSNITTMTPITVKNFNSDKVVESLTPELKKTFSTVICVSDALWAENNLRAIYEEVLQKKSGFPQVQSAHLKIILIALYRLINKESPASPICEKIKSLISENPRLNNKGIAKSLNYHPYYLNELFKDTEGITLHKYIAKQRMIKAYEMLNSTESSLDEIALACGFSSQAHMSTAFKNEYSITPSKLRKQV